MSPSEPSDAPLFLDVEDVIEIHALQLEVYGGGDGLRDRGLLESAVAQAQASFADQFVHDGLFAMAAAWNPGRLGQRNGRIDRTLLGRPAAEPYRCPARRSPIRCRYARRLIGR